MQAFLLDAAGGEATGTASLLSSILPLVLIFGVFYLLLIRPQKKREKQVQEMRSNLEVGDEIITIGGIIGRVVNIKDDWLVLETGSDRVKVRITRWAVQTNSSPKDAPASSELEK